MHAKRHGGAHRHLPHTHAHALRPSVYTFTEARTHTIAFAFFIATHSSATSYRAKLIVNEEIYLSEIFQYKSFFYIRSGFVHK